MLSSSSTYKLDYKAFQKGIHLLSDRKLDSFFIPEHIPQKTFEDFFKLLGQKSMNNCSLDFNELSEFLLMGEDLFSYIDPCSKNYNITGFPRVTSLSKRRIF